MNTDRNMPDANDERQKFKESLLAQTMMQIVANKKRHYHDQMMGAAEGETIREYRAAYLECHSLLEFCRQALENDDVMAQIIKEKMGEQHG